MERRAVTAIMATTRLQPTKLLSPAMNWKNCAASCAKKAPAAKLCDANAALFATSMSARIAAINIRVPVATRRLFHVVNATRPTIQATSFCCARSNNAASVCVDGELMPKPRTPWSEKWRSCRFFIATLPPVDVVVRAANPAMTASGRCARATQRDRRTLHRQCPGGLNAETQDDQGSSGRQQFAGRSDSQSLAE